MLDRTNVRYGMLIAISKSDKRDSKGAIYWNCICDCGNNCTIIGPNLTSGRTKSCGCLASKLSSERAKRIFTKEKKKCSVEGCDNNTSKGGKGLCGKHAQRMRRYGDTNYITSEYDRRVNSRKSQLKNKDKENKETTYSKYLGKHEHRVIAEKKYGRKINIYECVHHVDGNKHNNDPENLIILTKEEHTRLHSSKVK
jgi:hypothetical protein